MKADNRSRNPNTPAAIETTKHPAPKSILGRGKTLPNKERPHASTFCWCMRPHKRWTCDLRWSHRGMAQPLTGKKGVSRARSRPLRKPKGRGRRCTLCTIKLASRTAFALCWPNVGRTLASRFPERRRKASRHALLQSERCKTAAACGRGCRQPPRKEGCLERAFGSAEIERMPESPIDMRSCEGRHERQRLVPLGRDWSAALLRGREIQKRRQNALRQARVRGPYRSPASKRATWRPCVDVRPEAEPTMYSG